MKRRGISVRDKMETFNLSFETKELLESISDNLINNPESNVYSKGKRAWFKETKPTIINQIDRQLRKRYEIDEQNNLVACIHYPPEINDTGKIMEKRLTIKENKQNVLHRFIISTVHETCDVTFGMTSPETFEMRPWNSYKVPEMVGGMLVYEFKNEKNLIIPPKKGFRQVRKSKNIKDRYVIVLDYIISKKQYDELHSLISNKKEENQEDEAITNALEDLKL